MDLTQLANLGEFVGGVAVLVTLIYLVTEMRRTRLATETASVEALTSNFNSLNRDFYTDPDLLEIFKRGSQDPRQLDSVERGRFLVFAQAWINALLAVKRTRDRGALPDAEWQVYATGIANLLGSRGGEWVCDEAALPKDLRDVLENYRSAEHGSQWRVLKGEGDD